MNALSRAQFLTACKAFLDSNQNSSPTVTPEDSSRQGWSWNDDHSSLRDYGYMSRTVSHFLPSATSDVQSDGDVLEAESPDFSVATMDSTAVTAVLSHQSIVYSATFQVPVFYFMMHDSNGSPLTLSRIVESSIFRRNTLLHDGEISSFALTLPSASFPLLSQGEHPITGVPCWYIHPCEIGHAVSEIIAEVVGDHWLEGPRLLKWLEVWFMILGSIVDLRA